MEPAHVEKAVLAMPMAQTLGLKFNRLGQGHSEVEIPVLESSRSGQVSSTRRRCSRWPTSPRCPPRGRACRRERRAR